MRACRLRRCLGSGLGLAVLALAAAALVPNLAAAQTVSLGTGTYSVPAGTTHRGSIQLQTGSVVIDGSQIGPVSVGLGEVTVSGRVQGRVSVGMGEVVLAHTAVVEGAIQVGMGREVRLAAGQALPSAAVGEPGGHALRLVGGNLAGDLGGARALALSGLLGTMLASGVGPLIALLGRLVWWLVSLAVAFAILSLFPEPTRRIADDIERAPGANLGWGLLVALASGPAAVILLITILGIPLSLLLALSLLAAKVMGYVAVALLLGARLLPRLGRSGAAVGWELVAGSVLLLLVGTIPIVGFLLDIVVALVGIGACGRTGFGTGRPWFRAPRTS